MIQSGWRKSSKSGAQGNDCVEVRVTSWRKSSRSGAGENACVEARAASDGFQVRDSKLRDHSPVFDLTTDDFTGLLRTAKRS